MVKIQIDLTKRENQIVELYKVLENCSTKEEAIKIMIKSSAHLVQEKMQDLDSINKHGGKNDR